jgi:hypothetical protein
MFKLKTDRQVWVAVTISDPDGKVTIRLKTKLLDSYETTRNKHAQIQENLDILKAEAQYVSADVVGGLIAKSTVVLNNNSTEHLDREINALVARVTDWQDIGDESGAPVPFSPETFRDLLKSAKWMVAAITEAFRDLDENGKAKN